MNETLVKPRRLTIIESPFTSPSQEGFQAHLLYLRRALRHSWAKGELPFASHAFFPFFLHESIAEERRQGIEAGYAFWNFASNTLVAFYVDFGISPGMQKALDRCGEVNQPFEIRHINGA